jgi:phage terminase large subunit-like protein
VILAIDGTYRRSTAIVLATVPDAEIIYGWSAEQANDEEVRAVIDEALATYNVVEIVHFPKVRRELLKHYEETADADVVPWKGFLVEEVTSANEMHRAIVERRLAHDHHPTLMEHMSNVHARVTEDGLRLSRPLEDGKWIDAAMAARMAWWRAMAYEGDSVRLFAME